jgi:2-polyprenyl-3-methyl-5-hydroxy-6-metoxy-1,4-benzoquinol methylase
MIFEELPLLMQRIRRPELMDDPQIDPSLHLQALRGLRRINAFTRSADLLWPAIEELAKRGPIRVLDLSTGAADLPAKWFQLAKAKDLPIQFAGCDISPTAIETDRKLYPDIHFFQTDLLNEPIPAGYDVITCSLFLHHLSEAEVVQLLRSMLDAKPKRILINDLVRSSVNRTLVWIATRLLSRSAIVHYDGPVSVEQAFTIPEIRELAHQAGLNPVTVQSKWPCRFLLQWDQT